MIEQRVKNFLSPYIDKGVQLAQDKNISRKLCAMTAIALAGLTFLLVATSAYFLGLLTLLANRFVSLMVQAYPETAKTEQEQILEGFLGRFGDHLFFAGFIFFFSVSNLSFGVAGLFLLFAFYLNDAAYFAYTTSQRHEKSAPSTMAKLYGLVDDMVVTIVFALMCLISVAYPLFAIILGFMCVASAIGRFMEIRLNAKSQSSAFEDDDVEDMDGEVEDVIEEIREIKADIIEEDDENEAKKD